MAIWFVHISLYAACSKTEVKHINVIGHYTLNGHLQKGGFLEHNVNLGFKLVINDLKVCVLQFQMIHRLLNSVSVG